MAGAEPPMLPIVQERAEELNRLCRRFQVKRLDLFGSATRADFDALRSDLDFLVEFHPRPPHALADAYFGLRDALERLFERPIDLVTAESVVNPYFRESVEKSRQPVYAA